MAFNIGYLFFSAPYVGPSTTGPMKFISAVFGFLLACVVKCSYAALIMHNCEFSIHKDC